MHQVYRGILRKMIDKYSSYGWLISVFLLIPEQSPAVISHDNQMFAVFFGPIHHVLCRLKNQKPPEKALRSFCVNSELVNSVWFDCLHIVLRNQLGLGYERYLESKHMCNPSRSSNVSFLSFCVSSKLLYRPHSPELVLK